MIQKHAYLIVAHNQWDLLKTLLGMLDDNRNDIYLHIDRKAKDVPFEEIVNSVHYSRIVIVDSCSVFRGDFSLYEAEMILLRKAMIRKDLYSYFHLLSGQDLPLKNQDFIHNFFETHDGRNFIDVITLDQMRTDWYERAALYQFFSRFTLEKPIVALPARFIRKGTLIIQRLLHVNRFRAYEEHGCTMCYGSNWFSITRPFAEYLIGNDNLIRQMFQKHTFAPEELIPQTFLWSSEFRETLYDSEELDHDLHRANMRLVFWTGKTSPETITMKHMDQIRLSTNLFARKFDYEKYPDVVEAVIEMVNSGER